MESNTVKYVVFATSSAILPILQIPAIFPKQLNVIITTHIYVFFPASSEMLLMNT